MSPIPEHQKYYWLKLKRDFFKRHDIRIIEEMPNGKDYILFYLKLLVESIDHDGELRFSDAIPYNEQMLAVITHTNVDIVRNAMRVFMDLNMVDILDNQTIYMTEVQKLIGSETSAAERMRKSRENKKLAECNNVTPMLQQCHTEKEIEKELEKELDNTNAFAQGEKAKTKRFSKPSVEEIREYCNERQNTVDPEQFYDFYESKGWVVGKSPMKDWKSAVRTWERERANKPKQRTEETRVGGLGNSFDEDEFFQAALERSNRLMNKGE